MTYKTCDTPFSDDNKCKECSQCFKNFTHLVRHKINGCNAVTDFEILTAVCGLCHSKHFTNFLKTVEPLSLRFDVLAAHKRQCRVNLTEPKYSNNTNLNPFGVGEHPFITELNRDDPFKCYCVCFRVVNRAKNRGTGTERHSMGKCRWWHWARFWARSKFEDKTAEAKNNECIW